MPRAAALGAALILGACAPAPQLASVGLAEPPAHAVLFRDVTVFDGLDVLPNQDVLVTGTTIDRVGPTGTVAAPDGTVELLGEGRTLLPGLVDSHVHFFSAGEKIGPPPEPEAIAQAFLFAGVTSVLVASGFDEVDQLRAADAGQVVTPRLFTAGSGLSAPGGHPIPLLRAMLPWPIDWLAVRDVPTAATADEARAAVSDQIARYHPEFLKIVYDDLPPGSAHMSRDVLEAAIAEARRQGARPIVHATTPEDIMTVLKAGAALLMHLPQRGVLTDAQAARIAESNVPVVTTVRLVSATYSLARGGPSPLESSMFSRTMLQPWLDEPRWELVGFSEEIDERHDEVADDVAANTRELLDAGAQLFVGTDSGVHGVFPGASLHRELQLLTQLGMPPLDALRAATSAPAAFLDPSGSFGRIAAGQRADLLLVRGDPTRDMGDLAQIEEVFLAGARLDRQALR